MRKCYWVVGKVITDRAFAFVLRFDFLYLACPRLLWVKRSEEVTAMRRIVE
jgi:hypothetical protein